MENRETDGRYHGKIDVSDYRRIKLHEMHPVGVENLVRGILRMARDDYFSASIGRRAQAIRFFRSPWCDMLCGMSGEYILRVLAKQGRGDV